MVTRHSSEKQNQSQRNLGKRGGKEEGNENEKKIVKTKAKMCFVSVTLSLMFCDAHTTTKEGEKRQKSERKKSRKEKG